jgi:hypothetical protein
MVAMSRGVDSSARVFWARARQRLGALVSGQWRLEPGRVPVPIRTLASPLRFDIEVRRDFLALCVEHLERGGECDEQLTGLARSTSYWLWWTEVYIPRSAPRLAADPVARGREFAERVRASFELCRSVSEHGFDLRQPIVLKSARRVLPTDTGKLVEAPLFAGDGCHRIALLWLSGQAELAPEQYVVKRYRALAPLDNTFRLREAFAGDARAYLRFIGSGYGVYDPLTASELIARLRVSAPERVAEAQAVLRVDALC